ncbi:ROK domain-containing protein [Deinococcus phoenicis]|uniref:ROK domain-containing protein n=1 Tax=Deinococcus phoenicis TaxID=1476583 RepID=A0A016QR99_9DEIO|nr:ROK family transcriptional regulator [Deinococcus phoenicis]EYB68309.1 ROK domain-containing protein [Deinococcus phoenicis]
MTYAAPLPDTLDLAAIRARHTLLLLARLWQGNRARVDLARELGLSRSAISSIVTELMEAGLIHEAGHRAAGKEASESGEPGKARGGQVGRRATLLALNTRAAYLLAVDLGASHARVDLLDLRCTTLATRSVTHDILRGPASTYALLADLAQAVLVEAGVPREQVAGVGAGVPGPVDHATGRVVQPPNMPGWDGENVMAGLEGALGLGTRVDNDANLGALAENRFGAHRGAPDLIYVKAATGIGAGVLLGGRLHRGVRGGAGEIGHISINEQGPVGRSGNPGSLESYAAAQVLVETATARRAAGTPTALPDALTLADLIAAADTDPLARAVWAEAGHHLGVAISTALNLFNPSAVVIGGRLAQAGEVFLHALRRSALSRTMRINAGGTRIDLSTLGPDAGVLGAGAMLLDHLFTPAGLRHLYRVAGSGRDPPHARPVAPPTPPALPFSLGGTP